MKRINTPSTRLRPQIQQVRPPARPPHLLEARTRAPRSLIIGRPQPADQCGGGACKSVAPASRAGSAGRQLLPIGGGVPSGGRLLCRFAPTSAPTFAPTRVQSGWPGGARAAKCAAGAPQVRAHKFGRGQTGSQLEKLARPLDLNSRVAVRSFVGSFELFIQQNNSNSGRPTGAGSQLARVRASSELATLFAPARPAASRVADPRRNRAAIFRAGSSFALALFAFELAIALRLVASAVESGPKGEESSVATKEARLARWPGARSNFISNHSTRATARRPQLGSAAPGFSRRRSKPGRGGQVLIERPGEERARERPTSCPLGSPVGF